MALIGFAPVHFPILTGRTNHPFLSLLRTLGATLESDLFPAYNAHHDWQLLEESVTVVTLLYPRLASKYGFPGISLYEYSNACN